MPQNFDKQPMTKPEIPFTKNYSLVYKSLQIFKTIQNKFKKIGEGGDIGIETLSNLKPNLAGLKDYKYDIESHIKDLVGNHFAPKRTALSKRYPALKKPVLTVKKELYHLKNLTKPIAQDKSEKFFEPILVRHQSVLRRVLGDSDPRLQEQKVTNLRLASEKLNGLVIHPGEIFSFWETIGDPTYKNGYVDGMLLSGGKVVEGVGGGLCQMGNLLTWMFLHLPLEIVERYHHSMDTFPDSGRTIPFGSGATVMYNFLDVQIKNTLDQPIQLKIWVEDKYLKGRIVAPNHEQNKWTVEEKEHCFVYSNGQWFRYNQIWRTEKQNGNLIDSNLIFENFAPVLYDFSHEQAKEMNYKVINL